MALVALVTLLLLMQFVFFMAMAGKARVEGKVAAPAVTGDQAYERACRVHLNTLEQLAVTLPGMWICGVYFRPDVAAGLGFVFLIGRFIYRAGYLAEPAKRATGMMIGFGANVFLILTSLWGVAAQLII